MSDTDILKQNDFMLLLTRLRHLHFVHRSLLPFPLLREFSKDLNFSGTQTIPLASNKSSLRFQDVDSRMMESADYLLQPQRHKSLHRRESKSLSLFLFFLPDSLKRRDAFCFVFLQHCAERFMLVIFRISMHRFTCGLISLVELF